MFRENKIEILIQSSLLKGEIWKNRLRKEKKFLGLQMK